MRRNFLTRVFTVFLAVCSTAVAHAQFAPVPMGTTDSLGVPDYLVTPGDVSPPTDFLEWVETTLPEGEAVVFDSLPPVLGQELHFTESSDVWMTYVKEGAGYRNSVGYYTYDTGSPPTTVDDIDTAYSVFPNFSNYASGGGKKSSHKLEAAFTAWHKGGRFMQRGENRAISLFSGPNPLKLGGLPLTVRGIARG